MKGRRQTGGQGLLRSMGHVLLTFLSLDERSLEEERMKK